MAPAPFPRPGQPVGLAQGASRPVDHLRRRQDFIAVLQDGRRIRHRLISLGVRPNGRDATRVGYAIGKRVGTAVVRNRTRRRLREIARALPLAPGYDLVITGHPITADASFQALEEALDWCVRRAGVLTASNLTNAGQTS
ncbi:MAG: ribonuclease P protein component [Dehalococcoidia bacterium]